MAIINGTNGVNWLQGTNFADIIDAKGGNDIVHGNGGGDVILAGSGNDQVFGDAGDDLLYGDNGNDVLNGGAGADEIHGGEGSDTASYAGSAGGVTVNLGQNYAFGYDADGDTLESIENVEGSAHADYLLGTSGANSLSGGAGNDQLHGMEGNDLLEGGAGNDHLFGGSGFDTLIGGAGQDFMAGGFGADVFTFATKSDSPGYGIMDTIMDFYGGNGSWSDPFFADKIDLSGIDAMEGLAGDQGFILMGGYFTHQGQLLITHENGNTYVQGNTDNDLEADFKIELIGTHQLTEADFIL